jgi:glycosyltransferase involved in cell wall biosynthesis
VTTREPPPARVQVLYFADTRFPIERANGVQTMATCRALAARGHEVTLVVRPDGAREPRDPFAFYGWAPVAGLTIVPIPASGGPRARRLRFLVSALRTASQAAGRIIYTRDLGLAAALLQLPAARRPLVAYESHGIAPVVSAELPRLLGKPELAPSPRKLQRLERREQRVWRRAAAYVTITRALLDELSARYGPRPRVFVVPDGADPPDASETADRHAAAPLAAYAGHLYPWKGVDVFVRALASAPAVRGLIIGGHPGEPDRARIERLAADVGVADRLEITGLLPRDRVALALTRATMLVLPNTASAISERYTSPLKMFEYLWAGQPIIASDLPALREVLAPGAALFVPPGEATALGAAMQALSADPARSATLAAAARALAPLYTWEARAIRLEQALNAALAAARA